MRVHFWLVPSLPRKTNCFEIRIQVQPISYELCKTKLSNPESKFRTRFRTFQIQLSFNGSTYSRDLILRCRSYTLPAGFTSFPKKTAHSLSKSPNSLPTDCSHRALRRLSVGDSILSILLGVVADSEHRSEGGLQEVGRSTYPSGRAVAAYHIVLPTLHTVTNKRELSHIPSLLCYQPVYLLSCPRIPSSRR